MTNPLKTVITNTDMFCGCGGSSQGARDAGIEVMMAGNHWERAIETHQTNFP
ncbi:MAG: DNA cytosine methyltransferase, partial [Anaerolineaceae bacterium]|nr:DNA cytosine methyltransferase [Anaerolineaceae bacterium]